MKGKHNAVAVIGCGPAGLMSAWAVEWAGFKPMIFSRFVKSVLPGAQYLHERIPDLPSGPATTIRTERVGDRAGYALKVYGNPDAPVSWDLQPEEREAWDLRDAYNYLWARYEPKIINARIGPVELHDLTDEFALVISSIPLNTVCLQPHVHRFDFAAVDVILASHANDNTVIYDGRRESSITRTARVFGQGTTEFTRRDVTGAEYVDKSKLGDELLVHRPIKAIKVVGTDCDCWPEVARVGRYGTWRKSYLSHVAYTDASAAVAALKERVA